jgi:hypothetical protein
MRGASKTCAQQNKINFIPYIRRNLQAAIGIVLLFGLIALLAHRMHFVLRLALKA